MGSSSKGKRKRVPITKQQLAALNPVARAAHNAPGKPLPPDKWRELVVEPRLSYDNVIHGRVEQGDRNNLAQAANLALVLCEMGWGTGENGEDWTADMVAAQDAIVRAQERENDGKTFNFTASERAAVVAMLELYEQQLKMAGHNEVMRAIATIWRRVEDGNVVHVRGPEQARLRRVLETSPQEQARLRHGLYDPLP